MKQAAMLERPHANSQQETDHILCDSTKPKEHPSPDDNLISLYVKLLYSYFHKL